MNGPLKALLPTLLTAMVMTSVCWGADFPRPKVEYSADSQMETEGMIVKSKVYHALNKERMETDISGGKSIMIMRMDKKLSWVLMPEQRMYMEMSLAEGKKKSNDINDCKIEQKSIGPDVVNGVKTTKSKISMSCPDNRSYTGNMWITRDGILMKMDAIAKGEERNVSLKMELANLKIAKQDAGLFEVPAGYERMNLGGMMESMGTMMKNARDEEERARKRSAEPPSTSREDGRSYTAQPLVKKEESGRSYTSEPRQEGRSYTATAARPSTDPSSPLKETIDGVNKLKKLFSW